MAIKWAPGSDRNLKFDYTLPSGFADLGPKPDYAGAVLSTVWRVERIMSDVWADMGYARVWDEAESRVREVGYAGDGRTYGTVEVDATDDVKAKAAAYDASVAAAAAKRERESEVNRRVSYAMKVEVGKDVVVVKGRKVKKGTAGRVFWMGEGKWGVRVGLTDAAGATHWTAASNVEVANPDEYLDVPALIAYAA